MAGSRFSWRSIFACYGRVGDSTAAGGAAGRKRQRSHPPKAEPTGSDHRNPPPPFSPEELSLSLAGSNLHDFTLAELKSVTNNFSTSHRIGEGGFGPVFKGYVDDKLRPGLKPQHVAVKLLDHEGLQGHKEWLAEVMFLGQLRHRHLVKLIGYCCENEQRLLVYEFVSRGSLESHLFKRFFAALPWKTRIKIAIGAAKGLAFLHEAEKPVIYRDFKASNILLESDYTAKLSDFGLAKDGPEGEDTHVSTRVMGTEGYAAPEYVMTGHLNCKSDIYSFGVVLLELLSGRRCIDKSRPSREQNLVDWARPWLTDSRRLCRVIDPKLEEEYPAAGAQRLAELASRCLSHTPKNRPTMKAVVETLEPLLLDEVPAGHFVYTVSSAENSRSEGGGEKGGGDRESGQRLESKRDGDHAGDQTTEGQEDGNHVQHRRRTTEPRENGHKTEAKKEHRSDHRHHHHHHHASRHRSRTPSKPEAHTDTALYRKTRRHNHERGS